MTRQQPDDARNDGDESTTTTDDPFGHVDDSADGFLGGAAPDTEADSVAMLNEAVGYDFDASDLQRGESPPLSVVFDLLSVPRRRFVLRHLEELDGAETTVSELADALAEADDSEESRKAVYTALYQVHVPKMAKWGAVDHDPNGAIVAKGDFFDDYFGALARVEATRKELVRLALLGEE